MVKTIRTGKFSKEKHRIIFENEIKKNEKDICNT